MSVLSKEDFIARLQAQVGDDNSDSALQFVEDMTDTFNYMETRSSGNNDEQWEQRMTELDESWRKRYKERFFNTETDPEDVIDRQKKDVVEDSDSDDITIDELFEEREG